ncbi:hypothetical protein MKX03_007406, partial [Papaver bracteatum]
MNIDNFFPFSPSFLAYALILFLVYLFLSYYLNSFAFSCRVSTGTTCLVFKCKGGICMAADGLSTEYDEKSKKYVPTEEREQKIFRVYADVFATFSGHCEMLNGLGQFLEAKIKELESAEMRRPTAKEYAKYSYEFFVKKGYQQRPKVNGCIMFAAYDDGKPSVTIATKGGYTNVKTLQCIGSGGSYAFTRVREFYKYDMSVNRMFKLAQIALVNAARLDDRTGGFPN